METKRVYIQGFRKIGPFTNKENGEIIEGVNVFYHEQEEINTESEIGHIPSRTFLPPDQWSELKKHGIGEYDIKLEISLRGSKPVIKVKGFVPVPVPSK